MVTQVEVCGFCGLSEPVIRFGFNRNGTRRLRCQSCRKSWSPAGQSRTLSAEKEALIEAALGERLSQRAIARTLPCGRDTVRRVLKKVCRQPDRFSQNAFARHFGRCAGTR